jgi:hypothetical protein
MWTRYIYVIGASDNPVKIGVADDPAARMKSLQMGSADKLTLHHAIGVPFKHGHYVETGTHKTLAKHHRHGEWFNVTADYARAVILMVADKVESEYRASFADEDNLLHRAEAFHDMTPDWRRAVKTYKQIRSRDEAKLVLAKVRKAVVDEVGREGLTVLEIAISNPGQLTATLRGDSKALQKAERLLAKAMNAAYRAMSVIHNAALYEAFPKTLDEFRQISA